ncbi:glycosyltransferase family 39 protein [Christiangramia portivictoriae]|uniref:glycosyltransferase family 39 protein n=1 Tax=Christiangramia portivictoriae TaxID=326069 RepID=UPI0005567B74|nr:glycosyltransferase family 39 protein [Christiangramia portivictoriae]
MLSKLIKFFTQEYIFFLFLGTLGAICLYWMVKPHNVGFSPDSMAYLEMAENFSTGKGFVNADGDIISHWPPLYSTAIALTAKITGLRIIESGIILQPFLLFTTIIIFFFILKKLKVNNYLVYYSGLLLILSPLIGNFPWYLSEGLFYVFLLFSFYFLLKWHESRKRRYLIIMGFFCGLLFLTRYAGIGFIGGYLLVVAIFNITTPIGKIKDVMSVLFPLILSIIPWFLYIYTVKENATVRHFDVHIISTSKLMDLLKVFGFWFLGSTIARISFAFFMVYCLLFFFKRGRSFRKLIKSFYKRFSAKVLIIFLLCFIYISFLIISISFYDSWTPLDSRILSPVFIFIFILVLLFLQYLHEKRFFTVLIAGCFFLFLSFSTLTFPSHQNHLLRGKGYTREKWRQSETLERWKKASRPVQVFTNATELGYIHLGERFELLPLKEKKDEINNLLEMVKDGKAEIIFLNEVNWKNDLVGPRLLLRDTSDLHIHFFSDGFIIRSTFE